MATSSFKSTSKRPNNAPSSSSTTTKKHQNPTQKPTTRRSRSVSAFPRTHLDVTSEFNNTRDNPLFWVDAESGKFDKFADSSEVKGSGGGEGRRGRSVSRSYGGGCGGGGGGGRSFSTVSRMGGARRRRSPSSGPHCRNYESEKEQESGLLLNLRSRSKIGLDKSRTLRDGKNKLAKSASDLSEVPRGASTWSSQHHAFKTSDDSAISLSGCRLPHWDDDISTSGLSEVEEKTIEPVSVKKVSHLKDDYGSTGGMLETVRTEVRRAISHMQKDFQDAMRRSDSDVIIDSNFSDVAPELASPNAVDLVEDFREEFTRELEECEERARKLRAELAIEEHREVELSNILNNCVPEPKTPQIQRPCLVRKASTERRKMSKRLEEEAMAYFDECVSISTFDESDFSSLEDPPSHMIRVNNRGGEPATIPGAPSTATVACSFESQDLMQQSPHMQCNNSRNMPANGSSNDSQSRSSVNSLATKPRFSFTSKLSDSTSLQHGIRNYVEILSKDKEKESNKSNVARTIPRKTEDYNSEVPVEKYLLDRLAFRSRIESGGMLLCSGGIGFPRTLFCSDFW